MTTTLPLATLIEDTSMYPRNNMDESHVAELVRALASGARLPPIIADEKSLRIVDGFHRRRAMIRFYGDEAHGDVELRSYESESALFLEAVALNSVHGRRLDRHDQTRIVLKLREYGIEDRVISVHLHVPEPIVQKLSLRVVMDEDGEAQPSKRGFEHLRGQTLSPSQLNAVDSVRSGEVGRLCIELTKILDERLADLGDKKVIANLKRLSFAIEAALDSVVAA